MLHFFHQPSRSHTKRGPGRFHGQGRITQYWPEGLFVGKPINTVQRPRDRYTIRNPGPFSTYAFQDRRTRARLALQAELAAAVQS